MTSQQLPEGAAAKSISKNDPQASVLLLLEHSCLKTRHNDEGVGPSPQQTYLIEYRGVRDRVQSLHLSGNMNINACYPGVYNHKDDPGKDNVDRHRQTRSNGDNELENALKEVAKIARQTSVNHEHVGGESIKDSSGWVRVNPC